MNITYESDYRQKVLFQRFAEPTIIKSRQDVAKWRTSWTLALQSWHSPYKSIVDCQNLTIEPSAEVTEALARMEKFLKGFFLQKAVCIGGSQQGLHYLPFPLAPNKDQAEKLAGIRSIRERAGTSDFRANISLKNDFRMHVMELEFAGPAHFDSKDKVLILKSKLANNIMHWHSKWNLLVDCQHLQINAELFQDFQLLEKYFRGFFLKFLVGYHPHSSRPDYPFSVYRSRHKAVSYLESEGLVAGDEANCKSRK